MPMYTLDISHFSNEIELQGNIDEPGSPADWEEVVDLANIPLLDAIGLLFVVPIFVVQQIWMMFRSCGKCIVRQVELQRRRRRYNAEEEEVQEAQGGAMLAGYEYVRQVFTAFWSIVR